MTFITVKTFVTILCASLVFCAALERPAAEERKSRVIDNVLSDKEHYEDGVHNPDYDHDAIFGDNDGLEGRSPEEILDSLRAIADQMDKDNDGYVTHDELKHFIEHNQKRYIMEDVNTQWKTHNPGDKDTILWEVYKKSVYGFMENMDLQNIENDEEAASYVEMERRDKRRWEKADEDNDGALNKDEFTNFLHPEESSEMRDIVVLETLEDVDKNKDEKISVDEYIGDMYKGDPSLPEPDWVQLERQQFKEHRDTDNSGFMEYNEIRDWIMPPEYNHAEAETKHLINEADADSDGMLSKDEIIAKYDLFVGSQATDYGEALERHDEF